VFTGAAAVVLAGNRSEYKHKGGCCAELGERARHRVSWFLCPMIPVAAVCVRDGIGSYEEMVRKSAN
jgi:hypothetical protein